MIADFASAEMGQTVEELIAHGQRDVSKCAGESIGMGGHHQAAGCEFLVSSSEGGVNH
jgi:nanoRNase/pAp phosphatase (c-di-AMP/oligoRNAs hydrolase)